MKCTNSYCKNNILDFTGNTDGRCARCRLIELMLYFGSPKVDMMNMPKDEVSIDKQRLVEGGHI